MSRSFVTSDGVVADVLNKHENYLLDNYILQNRAIPVEVFGATRVAAISDGIDYLTSVGGGRIFVPADGTHFELEIRVHKDRNGAYHTNFEYHYDRQPTTEARPYTDEDWQVGDTIFNSQPNIDKCMGWVCTTAGTPGTWTPFGYTKKWFSEIEVIDALPDPSELQLGRQVLVKEADGVTRMYFCISTAAGVYSWVEKMLNGKSAYELALDDGFEGTEEEWIASLKGEKGETGNTYIQETPVFANSVQELQSSGDTTKIYVLPDGFLYAYMMTKQTVSTDVNELIIASYTPNMRMSTSTYAEVENQGTYLTGYISANVGDRLTLENISIPADSTDGYGNYYYLFDENKNGVGFGRFLTTIEGMNITTDDAGNVNSFTIFKSGVSSCAYIRICANSITADSSIIVNAGKTEEIVGYQWANTGHAFVPADYEEQIDQLNSRATSLETKTSELEDTVSKMTAGSDSIFTYVVEEAERVAGIVQKKRTAGSLTFTAMSDFHVEVDTTITSFPLKNNLTSCRDAGLGLLELQKHFKLDFAAVLGDYTYGDNAETIEQVKKDLSYVKRCMTEGMKGIPSIWATGNHDINYGKDTPRRMTEDELYAYLTSNNKCTVQDSSNIGRNYGYIDFENQKIRCIYLNTVDALDYPDNTDGTADDASEITATQAQWLVDVGLDFSDKLNPSDWGVVTLTHHCLSQFQPITTILTAYKNGLSGNVSMTTNGITTTVNYDFTNEDRGEIICAVHGHDHNFTYRKISDEKWYQVTEENAWLWSICVPNVDTTRNNEKGTSTDAAYKAAFGEVDANGNPVYYPKTQGTATSTSFCVITIDRKNRKISAIAYGAGTDREVSY